MAAQAPVCDFGWKAVDFELEGTDGQSYSLDRVRGPNGTLIMFICNHCPYVKSIVGRAVSEVAALKPKGIGAIAIMSNDTDAYPEDSFENMKAFAAEHGFDFPYAIDRTQAVASAYGAVCTPDFFGFDKDLGLQYRGRLDESKTTLVADAQRELYDAMAQIAETGQGPRDQIASMGCSIKWRAA